MQEAIPLWDAQITGAVLGDVRQHVEGWRNSPWSRALVLIQRGKGLFPTAYMVANKHL